MENEKITIEVTEENIGDIKRIPLDGDNAVILKRAESKMLLKKAQEEVARYESELAELEEQEGN